MGLGRRNIGAAAILVAAVAASCSLNPQPEPPAEIITDRGVDSGFPTANAGATGSDLGGAAAGGAGNTTYTTGGSYGQGAETGAGGTVVSWGGSAGAPTTSPGADAGVTPPDGGSCPSVASFTVAGGACNRGAYSTLPGVGIVFEDQPCVFTQAEALAGITFRYAVVVLGDTPGVAPSPQDLGNCGGTTTGGLEVLGRVSGGLQSYCVCDVGLCPPRTAQPITLRQGCYPGEFDWDGVNWTGPSDFGNPKGFPFPPGSYTVTMTATGTVGADGGSVPFTVTGTLDITITP